MEECVQNRIWVLDSRAALESYRIRTCASYHCPGEGAAGAPGLRVPEIFVQKELWPFLGAGVGVGSLGWDGYPGRLPGGDRCSDTRAGGSSQKGDSQGNSGFPEKQPQGRDSGRRSLLVEVICPGKDPRGLGRRDRAQRQPIKVACGLLQLRGPGGRGGGGGGRPPNSCSSFLSLWGGGGGGWHTHTPL